MVLPLCKFEGLIAVIFRHHELFSWNPSGQLIQNHMGGCVRYTLSVTKEEVNLSQHTLHIYKGEK